MLQELGFHKAAKKQKKEEWIDLPEASVPGMYMMRGLKSPKDSSIKRIQMQFTPEYTKQMEDVALKVVLERAQNDVK